MPYLDMTASRLLDALVHLGQGADRLRCRLHFDWSPQAAQAVAACRFLLETHAASSPASPPGGHLTLVAIVGGASSGKSTIFNNLLGGRAASRVTARGHSTMGLIAAVHERRRDTVEAMLASGLLLPSFTPRTSLLDDDIVGEPDHLHIIYHDVDALRDVLLFDTPISPPNPRGSKATSPWPRCPGTTVSSSSSITNAGSIARPSAGSATSPPASVNSVS